MHWFREYSAVIEYGLEKGAEIAMERDRVVVATPAIGDAYTVKPATVQDIAALLGYIHNHPPGNEPGLSGYDLAYAAKLAREACHGVFAVVLDEGRDEVIAALVPSTVPSVASRAWDRVLHELIGISPDDPAGTQAAEDLGIRLWLWPADAGSMLVPDPLR